MQEIQKLLNFINLISDICDNVDDFVPATISALCANLGSETIDFSVIATDFFNIKPIYINNKLGLETREIEIILNKMNKISIEKIRTSENEVSKFDSDKFLGHPNYLLNKYSFYSISFNINKKSYFVLVIFNNSLISENKIKLILIYLRIYQVTIKSFANRHSLKIREHFSLNQLLDSLNDREKSIVKELLKDKTYLEISKLISFSPSTVRNEISKIYKIFGVRNKKEFNLMFNNSKEVFKIDE